MYRLSSRELAVLAAVELRADSSVEEMAKAAGLKNHSANYYFAKLRDLQILGPRRAAINPYRVGFSDFHFVFCLAAGGASQRQRITEYLQKSACVAWFAEVGGQYQYAMSVRVRQVQELLAFSKSLSQSFSGMIVGQQMSIVTAVSSYGRRYLYKSKSALSFKNTADGSPPLELDQTDYKILSSLSSLDCSSERELSRAAEIPLTTVRRRVSRLEEAKVINGYYHHIDTSKLGYQIYKLLIFAKSPSPAFLMRLEKFAAAHPHVVHYLETVGTWQAELVFEVREACDASGAAAEIQDHFGPHMDSVHVIPLFRYLKALPFPPLASYAG